MTERVTRRGLIAGARDIARAGRSVIVLEARNRVGGRTVNHALGGGKVTETSDYWIGYMDGAVRSGERAAKEALAVL